MSTGASLVLILLTMLLSAFFSGSETAIVSCSKVRLHSRARQGSWGAKLLEKLLRTPEYFFSIVLVGTNLAVISCIPSPGCTLTAPIGVVSGDAPFDIDTTAPSTPTVDIDFDYSVDSDVDVSGSVTVLDALLIAQAAAGLPVTLACA